MEEQNLKVTDIFDLDAIPESELEKAYVVYEPLDDIDYHSDADEDDDEDEEDDDEENKEDED